MATCQSSRSSSSSSNFAVFSSESRDSSSAEEDEVLQSYRNRERKYAESMANTHEEIDEGHFISKYVFIPIFVSYDWMVE